MRRRPTARGATVDLPAHTSTTRRKAAEVGRPRRDKTSKIFICHVVTSSRARLDSTGWLRLASYPGRGTSTETTHSTFERVPVALLRSTVSPPKVARCFMYLLTVHLFRDGRDS